MTQKSSGSLTCAAGCWLVAFLAGALATVLLIVLGGWSFLQGIFVGGLLFLIGGALISSLICKPLPAPGSVSIAPKTPGMHPARAAPAHPAPAPAAAPAPTAEEPAAAPARTAEEAEPETLSAPRGGGADDLKLLKGVGPKLEQTLNALGFYHFDQIAKWTDAEIAWVDTRLKFKGRIERDGWIEQAKILAAGGETEFSKRKN